MQDAYWPFLKPLVDAPGSRYHLRDWNDQDQFVLKRYVSEGLLPDFDASPHESGRNDSILILANMGEGKSDRLRSKGMGSKCHGKILNYVNAARGKSDFHKNGPVRMLVWMNDTEKKALLPRTVHHRRKLSMNIEMRCDVEEVAGGAASLSKHPREDILEVASCERVARDMRKAGIEVPVERQDERMKLAQKFLRDGSKEVELSDADSTHSLGVNRLWQRELIDLERKFGATNNPVLYRKEFFDKDPADPELQRLKQLRRTLRAQTNKKNRIDSFLATYADLADLDLEAYAEGLDDQQREDLQKDFDDRSAEFETRVRDLPVKERSMLHFREDDRRGFSQNILLWDRRQADPLITRAEDFFTETPLALLDFQPRIVDEYPMTPSQQTYFDMIQTAIFGSASSLTYVSALDALAPGASKAVVPMVPEFRDPRKGGRRDVENLRVRTWTPEMLYKLALAWEQWPFKPSIANMLSMGSMGVDEARSIRWKD